MIENKREETEDDFESWDGTPVTLVKIGSLHRLTKRRQQKKLTKKAVKN